MASHIESATQRPLFPNERRVQKRHTIAAVVYFLYGVFYLFGAQYLVSMRATQRGMSNSRLFFILGVVLTIVLPLLIHSRFTLMLHLGWKPQVPSKTFCLNLTLILGLLVTARVVALLRGGLYTQTPLHTAALGIAAVTAGCLIWAGLSRPAWVSRNAQGP
ncbi:hypothetical protein NKDENANG_00237 [Candidatus Entotheonellaceae bacterium PAL068K]